MSEREKETITIELTRAEIESLIRAISTHMDRGHLEMDDADLYAVSFRLQVELA